MKTLTPSIRVGRVDEVAKGVGTSQITEFFVGWLASPRCITPQITTQPVTVGPVTVGSVTVRPICVPV